MILQSPNIPPSAITRAGVAQALVQAMTVPAGEWTHESAVELVHRCLDTHAWAIREEMMRTLMQVHIQAGYLTLDTIRSLTSQFVQERRQANSALSDYALFQMFVEDDDMHPTRQ